MSLFSRHWPIPHKICSPRVLVGTKHTQLKQQPYGSILSRALDYSDPSAATLHLSKTTFAIALVLLHACNAFPK